jgi:hypothetical protein
MKLNSAFAKGAFCPSCKKYVIGQQNLPDPAWQCVFCTSKICAYCYDSHTAENHLMDVNTSFPVPAPGFETIIAEHIAPDPPGVTITSTFRLTTDSDED